MEKRRRGTQRIAKGQNSSDSRAAKSTGSRFAVLNVGIDNMTVEEQTPTQGIGQIPIPRVDHGPSSKRVMKGKEVVVVHEPSMNKGAQQVQIIADIARPSNVVPLMEANGSQMNADEMITKAVINTSKACNEQE